MQFGRTSPCAAARLLSVVMCLSLLAVYPQAAHADTGRQTPTVRTIRLGGLAAGTTETQRHATIAEVLQGATRIDGFVPLYRKDEHLYAMLEPTHLDSDLMVLISIARGIAQRPLFSGATWRFGDDWVCQFRRVGDQVHFVRRNIRYRANPGTPEAAA
ncbi:MAG: hypothetical protein MI723_02245, partial [Caulobacterales bacterium]|nr:hypothetical protein [Caulobacterales bacterium]